MIPISIGMPYTADRARLIMKWKAPIPPGTGTAKPRPPTRDRKRASIRSSPSRKGAAQTVDAAMSQYMPQMKAV